MPLVYGTNFTNYKPLPKLKEKKPSGLTSFFLNLGKHLLNAARFLLDFVVDQVVANAIALIPGIGFVARVAIKAAVGFVSEVLQDLIFDRQINWKSLWIRLGFRMIGVGRRAFNSVKKSNKFVAKFFNPKRTKYFLKGVRDIEGFYKNGYSHILTVVKRESFRLLFKNLKKQPLNPAWVSKNKLIQKFTRDKLKNWNKVINYGMQLFRFFQDPTKTTVNIFQKRIAKIVRKSIRKMANKIKFHNLLNSQSNEQLLRRLKRDYSNKIILNSSWIYGLKVFEQQQWDLSQNITYTIYFYWTATKTSKSKGKLPIVRWEMPYKELIGWLNAGSPGEYYLNEIAWGKSIRELMKKEIIYLSKEAAQKQLDDLKNLKKVLHRIEDAEHYQQKWNEAITPKGIKRVKGGRAGRVTGNVYPTLYSNTPKEIRLVFASKQNPFAFTNPNKVISQKITRYKYKGGKK